MSLRNRQPGKGKTTLAYVPTVSAETGLVSATLLNGFFSIAGDLVTCFAAFDTDTTALGGEFSFELSLPFAIDVTAASEIIGTAGNDQGIAYGGMVIGSVANNTALVVSSHDAIASATTTVSFAYRVVT